MDATVAARTDRRVLPLLGAELTTLAGEDDTGGAWEAGELLVSPGAGSPPHAIAGDKVFYVAEGAVTFLVGDQLHRAPTGAVARIPAGTVHRYLNESDADARLVVITTGRGHLAFLGAVSALASQSGERPSPEAMAALGAEHDVRFVSPPPAVTAQ